MRMDLALAGAGVALLLGAIPAVAESNLQHLNTAPGVPLPLAVESTSHDDCSLGAPREMRVVVAPVHGEIALREGQLRRQGSGCPAAPGYVVLYVADSDFTGDDKVTIEFSEDGLATTLMFDIQIEGKTTASADVT